jgi:hypothetical protein
MKQKDIYVVPGVATESGIAGMRFAVGLEFTGFEHEYSYKDLYIARAVLLDLADAITAKLAEKAN